MPPSGIRAIPVAQSAPTVSSTRRVSTLFCICGEFILVCDKSLSSYAKRPADGSYVLRNRDVGDQKKTFYRMNARADKRPVLVKRESGVERIFRMRCTRCDLPIGYETSDPHYVATKGEKYKDNYTYILEGALTDVQNQLPEYAFERPVAATESVQQSTQ